MEMEDLRLKWAEIQQAKLSKDSRQVLHSASSTVESSTSITKSYIQLDKSSKSADDYLIRRADELDTKLSELVRTTEAQCPLPFHLAKTRSHEKFPSVGN